VKGVQSSIQLGRVYGFLPPARAYPHLTAGEQEQSSLGKVIRAQPSRNPKGEMHAYNWGRDVMLGASLGSVFFF